MKRIRLLQALAILLALSRPAPAGAAGPRYEPPPSPRAVYDFNPGWKFIREDAAGAENRAFDDTAWASVGTPHTWNDVDTYRSLISHSRGDRGAYAGVGWYRKHFRLPAGARGCKVILEFEGVKQAGRFFVNGRPAGKIENGVTACGLDITDLVDVGGPDNVVAVKVDNTDGYAEEGTGVAYQWMGRAFNPNFGGINRNVRLHVAGRIYQTFPLYENLRTTGVYIYAGNFDIAGQAADVTVESQVRNESGDFAAVALTAVVVDAGGAVRAQFESETSDLVDGETETFTATGRLSGARFWDASDPHLYDVYTILRVGDRVVDVNRTRTGFRKTEFRGGAGSGGVWLNGRFVWLTGYAQRTANDWPGLGQAYPDWMHDWNAQLVRESNANFVRWMHIAPQAADVRACDRFGIVEICPAGDKEGDPVLDTRLSPQVAQRQWEQRAEVMRDTIIYYRNRPSILFWEAGNQAVTAAHLEEMVALRKQWDPAGGRAMGVRHGDNDRLALADTDIAEYYGVMIGQDSGVERLAGAKAVFRGYSAERRDRAPFIECEDFRDEAPRGIWDDYSPPHFGFKPKGADGLGDAFHWNSETFCLAAAVRYAAYAAHRIDNPDPSLARWSSYCSIYWSDSDADGRQQASQVLRVSGKVDGVRLPKELFYVSRVMQSPSPDLHIIGHWTYPAGTRKTVYVAAVHCDQVELLVNGRSQGTAAAPCAFVDSVRGVSLGDTGCIYAFPGVAFAPGTLRAVARRAGKVVAQEELQTAGPPAALRLSARTGPGGLRADGSDVALIDVEAVDAQGRRCPTDEARVDFSVRGPAVWRGGFNAGLPNSTNNLYLNTECGINRVAVRSTLTPGTIEVTAARAGITPATVAIESRPAVVTGGLVPDQPPAAGADPLP